ncbi:MAG: type IV pilus secretin PilQ [Acidobacteriota bacterium]
MTSSAGDDSGAVASSQVATPAEIQMVEVDDGAEASYVNVTADRSMVWTTYRDSDGNLVVELPNTAPGAALVSPTDAPDGLLDGIEIKTVEDGDRPLTRLVLRTVGDTEHSLTAENGTLRLQLLPAGGDEPIALAYEPLPAEDVDASEPAIAAAPAPAPPAAYGTPDAPEIGSIPADAAPATELASVDVYSEGDSTIIQILGDGAFAYQTFRLENPDRFVLDLEGVVNTSARSTVQVNTPWVEQIRIGQFKPRPEPVSRVVFDLESFSAPQITTGDNLLTITFGDAQTAVAQIAAADTASAPETAVTEEPVDEVTYAEVEPADIASADDAAAYATTEDTYETAAAEDAVVAAAEPSMAAPPAEPVPAAPMPTEQVADAAPVPVYQPEPAEQVAAAPMFDARDDAMAPEMAADAAAPPSVTRPTSTGDVALFEAQDVQVADSNVDVQQVLPGFAAQVVTRRQRQYIGDPITMSLKNADLVETLRSFSRISDLNFVIQPGVSGSVTVELNNVPWDQALEQILKINNLGLDIDGTIVRIAPLDQLRSEARAQRELEAERARTIPLRTVMRALSYANAREIASLLGTNTGPDASILSSRGSVQIDQRTNTLIIRELPDYIDTVLAVIENLDTPEPQVKIEARIIEATKSFRRTLGIAWDYSGVASNATGNPTGVEFPNNIESTGGVALLTGGNNGFLNLALGNILDTFTLDAQIRAAENEGLVNVVSAPSVMTLNNERATIQSGLQIPIQTVANNTVSVQFVNATLQLRVQPQVTAEGTILMDIAVSKKEPQLAFAVVGATNAPIATREASTKVIVRDGGTAVIGGIYEVSTNQSQDRVPGLANIPVLGNLFKNRTRVNDNEELLIFVTPRIIQM